MHCLCRYLELFVAHAHKPRHVAAYSFSSTRGSAIANRVAKLALAVAETFHRLGTGARYILRIADHFYQIYRKDEDYLWAPIGELEDLENHLAEPARQFVPTRIDRISMLDSPLPVLMKRKAPVVLTGVGLPDDRLHAPDEKIALDQFWTGVRVFGRFFEMMGDE